MAELVPAPFDALVTRLYREPAVQDALFELPRRKWYVPTAATSDLSVDFHGQRAGNAAGPAAGPHTQMAQNLLLSYAAGGRILELKTVQVNDRLTIPRPCIDMTTIGYNVEWSQELLVEQSVREYVAGSMLIAMFRRERAFHGGALDGIPGEWIFDLSVGYDLAGIRSEKIVRFLESMRDASATIAQLRGEIPREFAAARDAEYLTRLSNSITLSTFHGCPAGEIEGITEFLIGDLDFDVIVKMNPPTLGQQELEHLLHDVLGYTELAVNPKAYGAAISFDEGLGLCERLRAFAAKRGRRVGFKFSNTLEVVNHRDFFPRDNEIMYLSGQPLHVITMALTARFREAVGPDVPISFSAGIDKQNFPAGVACGFVPVTVSTDLLRPGGYGRMGGYLEKLAEEMQRVGAVSVDEFILKRYGQETEARRRGNDDASAVRWAAVLNTRIAAEEAKADPRYQATKNRKPPTRIDSHLVTFDCITCDKCLPVCPNAANFTYPTPIVAFDYTDWIIDPAGNVHPGECKQFAIAKPMQIACFADFCNECGNCDTFCPEYGGPYIEKPSFFGSVESWERAAPHDGFVIGHSDSERWIRGRIKGIVYELRQAADGEVYFADAFAAATFHDVHRPPTRVELLQPIQQDHVLNAWVFHAMRHLLGGVADLGRMNQVNAVLSTK